MPFTRRKSEEEAGSGVGQAGIRGFRQFKEKRGGARAFIDTRGGARAFLEDKRGGARGFTTIKRDLEDMDLVEEFPFEEVTIPGVDWGNPVCRSELAEGCSVWLVGFDECELLCFFPSAPRLSPG